MDLFDAKRKERMAEAEPLAVRMRPRTLEEFAGQGHFLAPGKLLRRMLEADRLTSLIFYGPPGTGKTTLARIVASYTRRHFEAVNAASVGTREIRDLLAAARGRLGEQGTQTVLFLDEMHHFNRLQQDILLPDVEDGKVTLIGATTANPFFAVNSPLVSRSSIFQFQSLSEQEVADLLSRALTDAERGLGKLGLSAGEGVMAFWARVSDGDARRALTALEVAALSMPEGLKTITLDIAQESIQRKALSHDATGDEHYDLSSALIKSMRGGDPDAAVYWLARMLEAGEDPRFIARRIAILASEDIGMADPRAMMLADACFSSVERIGMPEAQLVLAEAAIYMATAPKSNACATAIWTAMKEVQEGRTLPVPKHLRDSHYPGARSLGHGDGYQYPHDHPGAKVEQDYLGVNRQYYQPTNRGFEGMILKSKQTPPAPPPK